MRYFLTCLVPAILFVLGVGLIYLLEIRLLVKWFRCKIKRQDTLHLLRTKSALVLHGLTIVGVLCFAWAYWVEPYRLEINTLTIQTEKLRETSLRIVQISDLHCDKKMRLEKQLVQEINQLHADLIVFTGDAINTSKALELFQKTLNSMTASLGKYAVRGNVDNRKWKNTALFENTGFVELSMDTVELEKNGETFRLCGIDEALDRNSHQALRHLKPEQFNILLFHTTALIDYMQSYPLDLYLCGHTHGGQVALPYYMEH